MVRIKSLVIFMEHSFSIICVQNMDIGTEKFSTIRLMPLHRVQSHFEPHRSMVPIQSLAIFMEHSFSIICVQKMDIGIEKVGVIRLMAWQRWQNGYFESWRSMVESSHWKFF